MSDYVPLKSTCRNCYRKFGDTVEVLLGADGTWVHTFKNSQHYALKCNPFEEWKAEPKDEIIEVDFSDEEYDKIKQAADLLGMTVDEFCNQALKEAIEEWKKEGKLDG